MMKERQIISDILSNERIRTLIESHERRFWEISLGTEMDTNAAEPSSIKLSFLLTMYVLDNPQELEVAELTYKLLKTIPITEKSTRSEWNNLAAIPTDDDYIPYYFLLCSISLFTQKTISARLALSGYQEPIEKEDDWEKRVLSSILRSLLYLVRKQDGYEDIRKVIAIVGELQNEQKTFENVYLSNFNARQQTDKALWLVSLYHASKAVVESAQYILQGYNYPNRRIETIVRSHFDIAKRLVQQDRMLAILKIIEADLGILIRNAIWTGTAFNDKLRHLCEAKGDMGILELLPSQRNAINQSFFDVAANAIVLQMPTSAGKTLLAEFNIAVTKSLLPQSKIVYVVPSRALVNQVYHDLRIDLSSINLSVEKTSSVNEIDPAEDSFLKSDEIDVLVSTPEKLDLLIRRGHPSVDNVSLFIIDEAHTISNGMRGARLELLIAILRRERPNAKYMLLSPFLPGDRTSIQEWLGGGNTIEVDWKPSEKIVIGLNISSKNAKMEMIRSPYSARYKENYIISNPIKETLASTGKERILEYASKHFVEDGKAMLILCQGRSTANKTAEKIGSWIDHQSLPLNDDMVIIQKYLEEEIGCPTLFSQLLNKRIAVHHAGLSDETKLLIEHLIRERQIQYVCATTTVAEGVNFPVSSVYFDSYYRGTARPENIMTSNDFWNIAGRAGRTMVDDFGKIILPFNSSQNEAIAKGIVSKSAEELVSVLSIMFDDRQNIMDVLNNSENPIIQLTNKYEDSFGPLFQYFIHLLQMSNNENAQDVEDLFKDTYIYSRLSAEDQAEFIRLCRMIYKKIEAKYASNSGPMAFADKTGFSVPSVLKIMAEQSKKPSISDKESWSPEALFNPDNVANLTEKIGVVAALRETNLGTDSKAAPFNPEIVAQMLISWVNGDKLNSISTIHPYFNDNDTTQRVTNFVSYMNGARFKASWGLSALEGIARGIDDEVHDSFVPSFVYYGVNEKKSLALRMIGIPRSLSSSLSKIIENDVASYSFQKLRKTVAELPLRDWDSYIPVNSKLSGAEWKRITEILIKER